MKLLGMCSFTTFITVKLSHVVVKIEAGVEVIFHILVAQLLCDSLMNFKAFLKYKTYIRRKL